MFNLIQALCENLVPYEDMLRIGNPLVLVSWSVFWFLRQSMNKDLLLFNFLSLPNINESTWWQNSAFMTICGRKALVLATTLTIYWCCEPFMMRCNRSALPSYGTPWHSWNATGLKITWNSPETMRGRRASRLKSPSFISHEFSVENFVRKMSICIPWLASWIVLSGVGGEHCWRSNICTMNGDSA